MGSAPEENNRLYLRLPIKIVDQHQICELHPKITIVHIPRQKSRRWCTVDFPNKFDLEEVRKALKVQKINGKKIVVKPFKIPKKSGKNSSLISEYNTNNIIKLLLEA